MTPDSEMASSFGMPNSSASDGEDSASARRHAGARARASISRSAWIGQLLDATPGARRVVEVVWGDFRDSWIRTGSTPTLATYLTAERAAPAPYDKPWLRRLRLAWAYTGGAAGTLLGHATAHLCQSPIRLAVTALLVAALYVLGGR